MSDPQNSPEMSSKLSSLKAAVEQLQAAGAETVKPLTSKGKRARTVSRLAAVQALYQMELGGEGVEDVIRQFLDHRFEADLDGEGELAEADEDFFAEVLRGVVQDQSAIDTAISDRLASGWRLERIDATVRAVLRCGAFELMKRPDVPGSVVIDEYVEIAKAFFDQSEAKFVNAALDGVSRDFRL